MPTPEPTSPPSSQPRELSYTTLTASQLSWQVAPPYLLITVNEPQRVARRPPNYVLLGAVWLGVFVITQLLFMPIRRALAVTGLVAVFHLALLIVGSLTGRRHLVIRVSREKLLIDECSDGSVATTTSSGVRVAVRGRSYTRDEVVSVTAAGSTLRVGAKNRRLERFSAGGYDPSDLAWTATAVTKVLAEGVEAWVAAQSDRPTS